jgi:hypothetical protein
MGSSSEQQGVPGFEILDVLKKKRLVSDSGSS